MARLMFVLSFLLAQPAADACTVFRSPFAGDTRYVHNVDWYEPFPDVKGVLVMNPPNLLKKGELYGAPMKAAEWVSIYSSLTFSIAGAEFPVSGFNEKGLSMVILELAQSKYPEANDPRDALGVSQFVQYNLDRSKTVDEVVASGLVIRPYSSMIHMHYMVCEASGKCAVIQYINGQMMVYRDTDLPFPVLTNSPYPESAAAAEACIKDLKSCPANDFSLTRFALASRKRSLMTDAKSFEKEAIQILEDVAQNGNGNVTRFQLMFDPANQSVMLRKRGNPKFGTLNVSFANQSCKKPRMILPVDASCEGDVANNWIPLTEAYQTDMAVKMGYPGNIAKVYGHYPFTVTCLDN